MTLKCFLPHYLILILYLALIPFWYFYLSTYPSIHSSTHPPIHPPIHSSIHSSIHPSLLSQIEYKFPRKRDFLCHVHCCVSLPGRDQQTESMHGILELKTVRDRLTLTMIWKGPCWGKSEDAVGSQKRGRQTSLSRRLLGRSGTRVVDEIQERKDSGSTDGRVTLK